MRLKVCSPFGIVLEKEIQKITLEGLNGFFTFLPHHIDFLSVLAPSIASYTEENGKTAYLACNSGVVLKEGNLVSLCVRKAIVGEDLKELTQTIKTEFKAEEEERKELSAVMARLEAGLSKGFIRLNEETSHAL